MDSDRTQFIQPGELVAALAQTRRHCLEIVSGHDAGRRFAVPAEGLSLGRTPPADIVLPDSNISRLHCRVDFADGELFVTDLQSTNGCHIEGERVQGTTRLAPGATLKVGNRLLKHEVLSATQWRRYEESERDLATAAGYVSALLPPPLSAGPIRTEWVYEPSAKLGGDAFGYGFLSPTRFILYLIDVSGHGAGAAMHSVAVMNLLRQRALPATDMADPAAVLATLNTLFQMDQHADMYFTMWYGVYDLETRRLAFAAAGHHPAYVVTADRADVAALGTRNSMIGAMPGRTFKASSAYIPPGTSLYMFSDGVFEIVTSAGAQWGLNDMLPELLAGRSGPLRETDRLLQFVRENAVGGELDDDFTLILFNFD